MCTIIFTECFYIEYGTCFDLQFIFINLYIPKHIQNAD